MKQAADFIILHEYPNPEVAKAWVDCSAQTEDFSHYTAPEYFLEPYWEGLRPFAILAAAGGNVV